MFLSYIWAFVVFLSAADLLMILRVYAMWNQSRIILYVLLLVYTIQTIITVVFVCADGNTNSTISVTTIRILDFSFCSAPANNQSYAFYYVALRLVQCSTSNSRCLPNPEAII